ncbi:MAG: sugar ABC transporter permease, partial [Planctomycetales bacterium]|nr:sugar ABC transporter permease [Planctomycetales bacterium]
MSSTRRSLMTGMAFVSPWLVGFATLVVYPFLASLYWSFCRYDLLSPPEWIGTDNYQRLARELATGEGFGRALWNTAYFAALSVPLSIALGV